MRRPHLFYFEYAREIVKTLHLAIKSIIKERVESLQDNPHVGKELIEELLGYRSLAIGNYRIIYRLNKESSNIEIHFIGHRRDVYMNFRKLLEGTKIMVD